MGGGSSTTTGHTGRIGSASIIGFTGVVPVAVGDYQFLVYPDTKKYGIKAICHRSGQHGMATETLNANSIAFSVRHIQPLFTPPVLTPITYTPTNEETFVVLGDGRVFATEITVKNFPVFPDYVFNKNYDLLTLYEIEKYINKYKHLPNIPSAKEVAEKGLSLGTMQVLQMEKIEELTLHLIELKKANDLLLKENELLKLEIEKIKAHLKID